jgi:hypothetical protein
VCWGCETHDDDDDDDDDDDNDDYDCGGGDVRVETWLYINKYVY